MIFHSYVSLVEDTFRPKSVAPPAWATTKMTTATTVSTTCLEPESERIPNELMFENWKYPDIGMIFGMIVR